MLTVRSSSLLTVQLLAVITFGLAAVTSVRADPITIVSGSATLILDTPPLRVAPVTLTGSNFSANIVSLNGGFGLSFCGLSGGPCTSANLSWVSSSGDLSGSFILNGMTFPANLLGLQFNSVTFVIPPEFFNSAAIRVTAPFTFSGGAGGATPEFPTVVPLTGVGTVHVSFINARVPHGASGFFLDRADYIFGPQVPNVTVEAVPEPMTLLLFASGVAGTAIRLRRRSKRLEKK